MTITRARPKNLVAEDNVLFEQEFELEVFEPVIIEKRLFFYNPYRCETSMREDQIKRFGLQLNRKQSSKFFKGSLSIKSNFSLVFDSWSTNYFHWFTEVVPKILCLLNSFGLIKVYIPKAKLEIDFVSDSLAILTKKYPSIIIKPIANNQNFFIWKGFVCSMQMISGNFNPKIINPIFSIFQGKRSAKVRSRKVFVFRKDEEFRSIINFSFIEGILKKFEYEIVDFSSLDFEGQTNLMSETKVLAAVHGAGLTNMLFMPEGSIVFELRRFDDHQNNCYFSLASAMNHDYYYLKCNVDDTSKLTQHNKFFVDELEFSKCLNQIDERLRLL